MCTTTLTPSHFSSPPVGRDTFCVVVQSRISCMILHFWIIYFRSFCSLKLPISFMTQYFSINWFKSLFSKEIIYCKVWQDQLLKVGSFVTIQSFSLSGLWILIEPQPYGPMSMPDLTVIWTGPAARLEYSVETFACVVKLENGTSLAQINCLHGEGLLCPLKPTLVICVSFFLVAVSLSVLHLEAISILAVRQQRGNAARGEIISTIVQPCPTHMHRHAHVSVIPLC